MTNLLSTLLLVISIASGAVAQVGFATTASVFTRLSAAAGRPEAPLSLTLELPLDSIFAKSNNEQSAWITFVDETGLAQRWPLHVDVRGKFRRRICTFPPLKLDFGKKWLANHQLAAFDKLKLVTPCLENEAGDELILREFLAYRLYQQLTPQSLGVQLLRITYHDANGNHPDQTRYAFVLEDTDELAARLGGRELANGRGLQPEQLDRNAETRQALFSYFIGNTDWGLAMGRNLKMMELPNGKVAPIPYDFDFSALVNAPYALPIHSIGQQQLTDRVYLGLAVDDELLAENFEHFTLHKRALLQTIRQFRLLHFDQRLEMMNYLESFYQDTAGLRRHNSTLPTLFARLRSQQPDLVPEGGLPINYGVGK